MDETTSPSTSTEALLTRWMTALIREQCPGLLSE